MVNTISWIINLAVWGALGVLLVSLYFKTRRAKKSQNDLVKSLEGSDYLNWFRVKLSTPAHFRKRMKIVGFESSAVLVNARDELRVIAVLAGGERLERVYPKQDLQLEWVGNPGLASSNMHWISLGREAQQVMISADTGFNAVQSREATADICRMINPAFQLPELARTDFALEKNKASLTLMIVFFTLLAFALFDGFFLNKNELVKYGNFLLLLPAMTVFAIPAYFLLIENRVPSRESLTLSLLLVIGLVVAVVPAMKRTDQLFADGARSYQYKLVKGSELEPVTAGPPRLYFRRTSEYWAQFEPGSIHAFQLINGPFGLWQLDRSKLNADFRKFYETYDAPKNKERDTSSVKPADKQADK
jgi:hypothetical protein